MQNQPKLIVALAFFACAFFFVQPGPAEEAFVLQRLAGEENSDENDLEENRAGDRSAKVGLHLPVTADGTALPPPDEDQSFALVTDFHEAEGLVVTGTAIPMDYP